MKIRTKWLAIFLVLGLVVAACGDGEGTTTTGESQATTTEGGGDTTTTGEQMAQPTVDVGVDLDAGVIKVGLLSDLSGVFSALVTPVVAGYQAKVAEINSRGGINGLQIELVIEDTVYEEDIHVQKYAEIKDEVVIIGHSTGSPHTIDILPDLVADEIAAIPLTWYSGWTDPELSSNLLHHGTPYCIESMNVIGYLAEQNPDAATIAIASNAGDYGQDSAQGAKLAAEALGLEVVYDGEGKVNAADEASLAEVAQGIIAAGADIVWVSTSPTPYSSIYGQVLGAGVQAMWSGSFVDWNQAFIGPESQIRDAAVRDMTFGFPFPTWSDDNPGTMAAVELIKAAAPDSPSSEYFLEGVVEAVLLEQVLLAAYESGDMTQAGVLNAARAMTAVDFNGLAPSESYVGSPNEQLQRLMWIVKPSIEDLEAGGTGIEVVAAEYTSQIAADYEFTEACFKLS